MMKPDGYIINYKDLPKEGKGTIPPCTIIQLEPCPFCGNDAYIVNNRDESHAECSNPECGARTKGDWNLYVVMDRWNKRIRGGG